MNREIILARWTLGTFLYFLCIGLWAIVAFWGILWLLFLVVPASAFVYVLGWLSSSFTRKPAKWPAFRNHWFWAYLRTDYFQYTLHGPGAEIAEKGVSNVMWAIYPHGVASWTAIIYWALNPKFEGVVPCIHGFLFKIPGIRDMVGWIGCKSVAKESMKRVLKSGMGVVLVPGGVSDVAKQGHDVKRRIGFIKLAKEHGKKVVPVWVPEERSYYRIWLPLGGLLEPHLHFPIPIFIWGLWWCPFLPKRIPTRIFVGWPIDVEGLSLKEAARVYYERLEELQKESNH